MSEWTDDDLPSWHDAGRMVEWQNFESVLKGRLTVVDQYFDGTDEWPIFALKDEAGQIVNIDVAQPWRYV